MPSSVTSRIIAVPLLLLAIGLGLGAAAPTPQQPQPQNRSVLRVSLAAANTSLLGEFIATGELWGHRSPAARPSSETPPRPLS